MSNRRRRSILKTRNSIVSGMLLDESCNANITGTFTLPNKRVSFGHKQIKEFQLNVSNTESPVPSPPTFNKTRDNNVDMTFYSMTNMDVTLGNSTALNVTYGGRGYEDGDKTNREEVMMNFSSLDDDSLNSHFTGALTLPNKGVSFNQRETNYSLREIQLDNMESPMPRPVPTKIRNNVDMTLYSLTNMDMTLGNSTALNATYAVGGGGGGSIYDDANKTVRDEEMMNCSSSYESENTPPNSILEKNSIISTPTCPPPAPTLPILTPRSMKTRSMAATWNQPPQNVCGQDLSKCIRPESELVITVPLLPSNLNKVAANPFRNRRLNKKRAGGCIFLNPKTPRRIQVAETPAAIPTTSCAQTNTTPEPSTKQIQISPINTGDGRNIERPIIRELINAACQTSTPPNDLIRPSLPSRFEETRNFHGRIPIPPQNHDLNARNKLQESNSIVSPPNNYIYPSLSSTRFEDMRSHNQQSIIFQTQSKNYDLKAQSQPEYNNCIPAANKCLVSPLIDSSPSLSSMRYEEMRFNDQSTSVFDTTPKIYGLNEHDTTEQKSRSRNLDATFVLGNELNSPKSSTCIEEMLSQQLSSPRLDISPKNFSFKEQATLEEDECQNANVTFVLHSELSIRNTLNYSEEMLDHQESPNFDSTVDSQDNEADPVEPTIKRLDEPVTGQKNVICNKPENLLNLSQSLFRYVTQYAEFDVETRIRELDNNVKQEIAAMDKGKYSEFKLLYFKCFLPKVWQGFEIHRSIFKEMGFNLFS